MTPIQKTYTYDDIDTMASALAEEIISERGAFKEVTLIGVPRGGIFAAYAVANAISKAPTSLHAKVANSLAEAFTRDPEEGMNLGYCYFIDDLIDSGDTKKKHQQAYDHVPFRALHTKTADEGWLHFPWERETVDITSVATLRDSYMTTGSSKALALAPEGITSNITRILQYVGEDTTREGLLETPERVQRAWGEITQGYKATPESLIKVFDAPLEGNGDMVLVDSIPFYSNCEHHFLPFFGTIDICYIPTKHILGLSKFKRLVNIFAQRLQVQERLGVQIAEEIMNGLHPTGVAIRIRARHLCMEMRGVHMQGSHTVTTSYHGAFKQDPALRLEFLSLIN